MKKALIIAWSFPPRLEMGAQRPYRLAKYFLNYGWEPIILTAKLPGAPPGNMKIIETEYKDIISNFKMKMGLNRFTRLQEQSGISNIINNKTLKGRILKSCYDIIAFPDPERGWYEYATKMGSQIIKSEPIDIIISTSPPVTSHLIARKLKKIHKKPWVADLRDLWTQNHYYSKMGIIKNIERYLEVRTLTSADALVTVSIPLAEKLKLLHNNNEVVCITNGFDPAEVMNQSPKVKNKFTITYTGALYNEKRSPSLLLEAIAELIKEGRINKEIVEVIFYTGRNNNLIKDILKYDLDGIVRQFEFIPREEVLQKQRDSQLLLLLLWNNNEEVGVYTGKIFEYLAARRPIIAMGGPSGVVRKLLEDTNAGKYANNIMEVKKILIDYYEEYALTGEIKSRTNWNMEKFSYINIARTFARLLDEIIIKN
jgi:glycosyltransferase involved in cell wall biosynthesis